MDKVQEIQVEFMRSQETSNAVFSKAVSYMFSMQIWGDYLGLGDEGKQTMNAGKV